MIEEIKDLIPDRFQDPRILGSGSASSVFKAWDQKQQRFVAVKIAKKEEFSGHVKKDFEILSDLNHPNLCRVYSIDVHKEEGLVVLYLEYIDGIDILQASVPLDFALLARRLKEILLALDYIHSKGLVHLDIKIKNILVQKNKRWTDGEIKILDFGISKKVSDLDGSNISGTVHYIAPEQFLGNRISQKADLFSLGVLLYRIITTRFPFEGKSINQVMQNIINATPILPYILNPNIPYYMNMIIENLLQKDPGQRFDSAREILDILNSYSESYDKHFSYTSGIMHPSPFVGRDDLIGRIDSDISAYFNGENQQDFIVLYGEKGIGKTSVLNKINNILLLKGYGSQIYNPRTDSKIPYEMIFDLLTLFMDTSMGFEYKGHIERLFDEYYSGIKESIFLNRNRIFESLIEFFKSVSADTRCVFLIDDFELSGKSDIDLLNNLIPAIMRGKNFVFLVTCDESDYRHISRNLSFPVKDFKIGALSENQTIGIIETISGNHNIPQAIKRYILENSGGNPTFIVELFRHIWSDYIKDLSVDHIFRNEMPVTNKFRFVFDRKIKELKSDELLLLRYAALFNLPFRVSTISELLEKRIKNVPEVIEGLINKDILEHMQGERFIRSKRRIYNIIIKEGIDKNAYREIHRKIALFLERKKPDNPVVPDEEIAYHFIEARDATRMDFVLSVIDSIFRKGSLSQSISMIESILEFVSTDDPYFENIVDRYFVSQYYSGNYKILLRYLSDLSSEAKSKGILSHKIKLYQAKVYNELRSYTEGMKILEELGKHIDQDTDPAFRYDYLITRFIMSFRYMAYADSGDELLDDVMNSMQKDDMPDRILCEYKMALANYYYIRHKFKEALSYWIESYKYYKTVNDLYGLSRTSNNISLIHLNNGNVNSALKFMNESAEYDRLLGNLPSLGKTYGNLGVIYQHKLEFSTSLRYYLESLNIREKLGLSEVYKIYNNIIYIYYVLNRYDSAFELISKIENDIKKENKQEFYNTYISKAKCLMDISDYNNALDILDDISKHLDEWNFEMSMIRMKCLYFIADMENFEKISKTIIQRLISGGDALEGHSNSIYESLEFFSENRFINNKSPLKEKYLRLKISRANSAYRINILYCLSNIEEDRYLCLEYLSNAIRFEKRIGRPLSLLKLYYRKSEILFQLGQRDAGTETLKMANYYFRQLRTNIPCKYMDYFNNSPFYKNYIESFQELC